LFPPVIFRLIGSLATCSYQHTGFVLIETAADLAVIREHRDAEIFFGSLNYFESWRRGLLSYICKSCSQGQPPQK